MPTWCCPECFDDRGLRKNIIPSLSTTRGACNFCQSADVDLVEPRQLADVFEILVSVYEFDPDGKPLVEWMKEDWLIFSHLILDMSCAEALLSKILDNDEIVQRTFSPSDTYKSEGLAQWDTLRDEILCKNRYFLDAELDTDRLKELLAHLHADDMPEIWFRARILTEDPSHPYPIEKMGVPPKHLAAHGRANPIGIPYLYLASHHQTAAAEIRPHTGEVVCVAEFSVLEKLTTVDLRNPRKLVSPFVLADTSAIAQMRADIPFLERLGEELTRPVLPRSSAIDYIPSQYLCEFIKKIGYDGVVYRSSVSSGMNLALFNPEKAVGRTVSLYNISRVSVDVEALR